MNPTKNMLDIISLNYVLLKTQIDGLLDTASACVDKNHDDEDRKEKFIANTVGFAKLLAFQATAFSQKIKHLFPEVYSFIEDISKKEAHPLYNKCLNIINAMAWSEDALKKLSELTGQHEEAPAKTINDILEYIGFKD